MRRLRLVKVVVQPILVCDDGEYLQEIAVDPATISAAEWDDFARAGFTEHIASLQKQLEEQEKKYGDPTVP